MKDWIKYWFFGFIAWVIVDFFGTNAVVDLSYYNVLPFLLIFYIGYPLIFSQIIYRFNIREIKLVIVTILAMFLLEVSIGNMLFFQYPLIIIPLGIAYYMLITVVPLWIVENKIIENKKWFILILIVTIIGFVLNILSQLKIN